MHTWKSITENFTNSFFLYWPDWLSLSNYPALTTVGIVIYAFVMNDVKDSIRSGKFTGEDNVYSIWTVKELAKRINESEYKIKKGLRGLENSKLISIKTFKAADAQLVIYPQIEPYINPPESMVI